MPIQMEQRGPEIDLDELLDLEKTVGYSLPEDYRNFLLKFNGGIPEDNIFDLPENNASGINLFMGIDDIKENREILVGRVVDGALPIADASCGNVVVLVSGTRQGLYYWHHEFESDEGEEPTWDNMDFLAPTFTDFWNSLRPFDQSDVEVNPEDVISVLTAPDFDEKIPKE